MCVCLRVQACMRVALKICISCMILHACTSTQYFPMCYCQIKKNNKGTSHHNLHTWTASASDWRACNTKKRRNADTEGKGPQPSSSNATSSLSIYICTHKHTYKHTHKHPLSLYIHTYIQTYKHTHVIQCIPLHPPSSPFHARTLGGGLDGC